MDHHIFSKTIAGLKETAIFEDAVLVSFSGGKDSLVILDLCAKIFKKVTCFFMYFVPSLSVCERQLQYARDRYGIEILQYPHYILGRTLANAVFCDYYPEMQDFGKFTIIDIYALVRKETGVETIVTGAKKSDSFWRRRYMGRCGKEKYKDIINPLADWNKFDILAYLKVNNIPIPDCSAGNATGIDLSAPSLLWLHDNHPDDFAKLCRLFPYAEAVIYRRQFYGKK